MQTSFAITSDLITKIHSVLDKGLTKGIGNPTPGEMCVEAASRYFLR